MKFIGLLAVLLAPGMRACRPRMGTALLLTAALVANLVYSGGATPPADWQAINTVGEDEARDDYWTISKTIEHAEASNARVVVFPEGTLPQWTASAESFPYAPSRRWHRLSCPEVAISDLNPRRKDQEATSPESSARRPFTNVKPMARTRKGGRPVPKQFEELPRRDSAYER